MGTLVHGSGKIEPLQLRRQSPLEPEAYPTEHPSRPAGKADNLVVCLIEEILDPKRRRDPELPGAEFSNSSSPARSTTV